MSESLDIHLSDDAFAALCRKADATGMTPGQLAARTLEERFAESPAPRTVQVPGSDADAARRRFRRHFGSVDLGHATGADNRGIDEDLASEYAQDHKDT